MSLTLDPAPIAGPSSPRRDVQIPPAVVHGLEYPQKPPGEEVDHVDAADRDAALLMNLYDQQSAPPRFPFTPPDEPQEIAPVQEGPSSPTRGQSPIPLAVSPESKKRRKRNTAIAPEGSLPPHYLGQDNETYRCICGVSLDTGTSIQCEKCGAWHHARCWDLDDDVMPEVWYCELCEPRPFDAVTARAVQVELVQSGVRAGALSVESLNALPKPAKPRKTKRQRTGSVLDEPEEESAGAGVMAPPKVRRKPGPKPRSSKADTVEPPAIEEDYFRIDPWEMEFTPITENVVRGVKARKGMRALYREWIDLEDRKSNIGPSGLPSPTETGVVRLSPDLYPEPDFSTLAPPIPPVLLPVEPESSSFSVVPLSEMSSFLPISYDHVPGLYPNPPLYAVVADQVISTGDFVGEYSGEVIDSASYRRDPINQYASLGIPKPFVRGLPPPVNLMIDARGYGNKLRFVRNGCHPNVVLRPMIYQSDPPKLKFGLFASRKISRHEELMLGWEWDDGHVIHAMRECMHGHRTLTEDILEQANTVLTHLLGTFTTCACEDAGSCAVAAWRSSVEKRKPVRSNMGALVGAVRGWRRQDIEEARIRHMEKRVLDGRSATAAPTESSEDQVNGIEASPVRSLAPSDIPEQSYNATAIEPSRTSADDMDVDSPLVTDSPPRPQTPIDDGHLSDATTATLPRTNVSDSEDEVVRVKAKKGGKRARRVLSPVAEKPKILKRRPGRPKIARSPTPETDITMAEAEPLAPQVTEIDLTSDPIAPPRSPSPPAKEDTPPREPTPPRQPTPPPAKKVSLSEYLKAHKIRKDSSTVSSDDIKEEQTPIPTPDVARNEYFSPTTQAANPPLSVSPSLSAAIPPLGPSASASAPLVVSSSYVPRKSSSFTPRAHATYPEEMRFEPPAQDFRPGSLEDYLPTRPTETYIPPPAPAPTQPARTVATPPLLSPLNTTGSLPAVLPNREAPPHSTSPINRVVPLGPKIPPTGPKVPPVGPRSASGGPPPNLSPSQGTPGLPGLGMNGMTPNGPGMGVGMGMNGYRGPMDTPTRDDRFAGRGRGGFARGYGRGFYRGGGGYR